MPRNLILSFLFYAFVSGITPGPANLCSLSAALRYGRKTALKQWTGLFTGFFVVSVASAVVCYLIGTAFGRYVRYLSYAGMVYLLFLAWKMLKSTISESEDSGADCNFFTGLFVQLTNVKIMVYCLTSFSIYVLPYDSSFPALLSLAVVLPFTGPICNLAWLFLGDALRHFFVRWQKQVNIAMSISLILCALTLLL